MTASHIVFIAAGGAFGAVARYMVTSGTAAFLGHGYPFGTLLVNVLGSFVLGALVEIFAIVWSPPQELRMFLVVGLLGGFTTFSTFSLDTMTLMQRGQMGAAFGYVIASVVLSVGAFWLGLAVTRMALA